MRKVNAELRGRGVLSVAMGRLRDRWTQSARSCLLWVERYLARIVIVWFALAVFAGFAKLATSPFASSDPVVAAQMLGPFVVLGLSPIAAVLLTNAACPADGADGPVRWHLAHWGKWSRVPGEQRAEAIRQRPGGLLASLVVGLLFGTFLRGFETIALVPAVPVDAPQWALALTTSLTLHGATVNFFAVCAVVMAIRGNPLFPRMLLYTWLLDIAFQGAIAASLVDAGLPGHLQGDMAATLETNLRLVFTSIALWLPFLLVSRDVNLIYRGRVAA